MSAKFDALEIIGKRDVRAELGRHDCPVAKMTVMLSTPGFWDEGPGYGVGVSMRKCEKCAHIWGRAMSDIFGGCEVRW